MAQPLTRRQFTRAAALAVPGLAALRSTTLFGAPGTWHEAPGTFAAVTIGAITYSFRSIPKVEDIIAAYKQIGLTSCELMSNHCEALAGAPQVGRGMDREPLLKWRADATQNADTVFAPAKKAFNDAGVDVRFLTYNMSRATTPEEMEYAFAMAKALKVKAITTSEETVEFARAFGVMLGKTTVESRDRAGFIVNRLLIPYLNAAVRMLEEGFATREDIDTAIHLGLNHPMGPLQLVDFIGVDTTLFVANVLYEEFRDPLYAAPPLLKRMVTAGHLGRKTGRGFYEY